MNFKVRLNTLYDEDPPDHCISSCFMSFVSCDRRKQIHFLVFLYQQSHFQLGLFDSPLVAGVLASCVLDLDVSPHV